MVARNLNEPILDAPLRHVNFFNGRLLSAEALSQQQTTDQDARRQLGQLIGYGVAHGLQVTETIGESTAQHPVITIQSGLAINRDGDTLWLNDALNISLVRPQPDDDEPETVGFDSCVPPEAGAYVAGAGAYILTISPVEVDEGRAQVSGLGSNIAACNTKTHARGVMFRLIGVELEPTTLANPGTLRNRLAYRCYGMGSASYRDFINQPFSTPVTSYGLLDELRPNQLKNCEVPLALFYWTSTGGLQFLDMWSVRRRIISPTVDNRFPLLTGDRRRAEGEAMYLQFADHLDALRKNSANPTTIRIRDHFRYLPPVGIIPLSNGRWPVGFMQNTFFTDVTVREPMFVEGARVSRLIHASWDYPPLDLNSGVMVWLYRVRENAQAIADLPTLETPQPYLIYATGHMPYIGDAHTDVNRADYANSYI